MTATDQRRGRRPAPGGVRTRMFQMRMNEREYDLLQTAAESRNMNVADLVRSELKPLLSPTESSGSPEMPLGTVDLATWLADRLSVPTGVGRLYIEAGRVTIGGKVFRQSRAPKGKLDKVALDGEPV